MTIDVTHYIDLLEIKIKEYRSTVRNLNEAKCSLNKLNIELDNIKNSWEYDDEDLEMQIMKINVCLTDINIFNQEMHLCLQSVKFAAYRLGRTRSKTSAEP